VPNVVHPKIGDTRHLAQLELDGTQITTSFGEEAMDQLLKNKLNEFRTFMQAPERKAIEEEVRKCSEEYQRVFSPDNIENLQKSDMESFLDWQGRWSSLFRQKGRIVSDMNRLKTALSILLNEERSVEVRLNELEPGQPNYVKGFGRAVKTAILHLVYSDKYGVYNRTSEEGLQKLGLMPKFDWGEKLGSRYLKVNKALLDLSQKTGLSLAEVDSFVWFVLLPDESPGWAGPEVITSFEVIEKHLQKLLADNWEQANLAKEWGIYEVDGEPVGVEFPAGDAGRIDILCRKRGDDGDWQDEWLIVELKRDTGGHAAIGQLLGYMGWVQDNLADSKSKEKVRGLLIVRELDSRLKYALKMCGAQIEVKKYSLSMSLDSVNF